MLMQALPVEQETELERQVRNCYALLEYIDGKFRERLAQDAVNYKVHWCGTEGCLLGWYAVDVVNLPKDHIELWCVDTRLSGGSNFGAGFPDTRIFNAAAGDIHDRRAALVSHIKDLEAQL